MADIEIEVESELGQSLKGLLASFMMEGFDASIKSQNEAIVERASSIAELTEDDAPMGFPILHDIEESNLLQYLNKHNILTFSDQLNLAADSLSDKGQRKINTAARKRLLKVWKGNYEGKTRDLEVLITQLLLHPNTRGDLVGGLQVQANWIKDPVVKMLRTAHSWLGLEGNIETVKGFTEQFKTKDRYWPLEIWESVTVDEFGRYDENGAKIANALEGFLIRLLSSARSWEELSEKQQSGVLLGIYAASSLMSTRMVLVPFDTIIPNLSDYLNFNQASAMGLCDSFGEPTPLFNFARNLAKHIKSDTGSAHAGMLHTVIQSIIETAGADISCFDGIKKSLRTYYSGRLAIRMQKIFRNLKVTINTFRAEKSPYTLTDEGETFINDIQKSIETWRLKLLLEVAFDSSKMMGLTDLEAARYDYWVAQFTGVAAIEGYGESFGQYLTEKGANIEVIQQRAQEAVLSMDTGTLAAVAQQMADAKTAAEGYFISLYKPLIITDEQLANQPIEPETIIEAKHEGVDDHLLDDIEQTIAGLESALDVEKQRASQLGKSLALANDEITQLKAAAEADAMVNSDAFVALIRSNTPLAIMEAFKALAGSHVVVLDSALASAKKSAFKNTAKLMEALSILADDYYNQIVVEGKPDAVAKNTLGFAYRAGESDQTMAVSKLRAQREFKYEGELVTFTQHLTLGTKRGNQSSIQVHFKIIDKKLVIARVGTHLDVASS